MNVGAFHGDVVGELGLGVFRWADVTLGGLDNREARLAINRHCFKLGRPWIDGAIEQIQGWARFFSPLGSGTGPCYECTMSERDWKILAHRRSCNLLTKSEMETGRTPTTPTIASIIAGVQCQEAVKYLHGLPTMAGKGWAFGGMSGEAYAIEYQRKPDCLSHDPVDEVVSLDARASTITGAELLAKAREVAGKEAVVELPREVVEKLVCPQCREEEPVFAPASRVRAVRAACPSCQDVQREGVQREVVAFFRLTGSEPFLDRSLAELGIPAFDILFASGPQRLVGLELCGDARGVLGGAAGAEVASEGEVEWL
jgi:adenylyltransferase/sulfurtransferase